MSKDDHGFEISFVSPGWIKKKVPESYADDVLKDLILFYVINTPCADLSSSGILLKSYGWKDSVWKNNELKEALFSVANLKRGETFFVAHKTNEMKEVCKKANLSKDFSRDRSIERIAIYKGRYNEFLSICYHIRNAFAHGRLAMYDCDRGKDIMFVLEDGIKKNNQFYVRSRMVLKKSTLKKWMDVIKSGHLPS